MKQVKHFLKYIIGIMVMLTVVSMTMMPALAADNPSGDCGAEGSTIAWTGASHVGNFPAKCSVKIPMNRSIEPNTTR